ncbi:MAG: hypothetical protein ACJ790_15265 [Myxococcaceae bacterium]
MRSLVAPLLFASLAACTASRSAGPTPVESESASAKEALPFIEDDYARAVTEAKTKKLPIFVDVWAPW